MSEPTIDIERVVREVLAELGVARKADEAARDEGRGKWCCSPNPPNVPEVPEPAPLAQSPLTPGELIIDSRVVTMTEVSGRLDAVRRVVVSREAIVTPAVRDELLRRGIALAYAESSNGHPATPVRLVMITTGTDFDPAALVAGLTREGLKVEHAASDCLIAATDQLAAEVARPDTLGVLLTRHTAAGLCLANRLGGVRAVAGVDAPAVAAAAAAVGANCWWPTRRRERFSS